MKTVMHNVPGYGASPETVFEYDYDLFTARQIVDAVGEMRVAAKDFALFCATRLTGHDIWARDLNGKADAVKLERFRAALDELIDDFSDQDKLAEAEELS